MEFAQGKPIVNTYGWWILLYLDAKSPNGYWRNVQNCRQFFDDFANEQSMDPLDPSNWYRVNLQRLCERRVRKTRLETLLLLIVFNYKTREGLASAHVMGVWKLPYSKHIPKFLSPHGELNSVDGKILHCVGLISMAMLNRVGLIHWKQPIGTLYPSRTCERQTRWVVVFPAPIYLLG